MDVYVTVVPELEDYLRVIVSVSGEITFLNLFLLWSLHFLLVSIGFIGASCFSMIFLNTFNFSFIILIMSDVIFVYVEAYVCVNSAFHGCPHVTSY